MGVRDSDGGGGSGGPSGDGAWLKRFLASIARIKSQKQRPNLDRICQTMRQLYSANPGDTVTQLQVQVDDGKVLYFENKGVESYADPKFPPMRVGKYSGRPATEATWMGVLCGKLVRGLRVLIEDAPDGISFNQLSDYLEEQGDLKDTTGKGKVTLEDAVDRAIQKGFITQENELYKLGAGKIERKYGSGRAPGVRKVPKLKKRHRHTHTNSDDDDDDFGLSFSHDRTLDAYSDAAMQNMTMPICSECLGVELSVEGGFVSCGSCGTSVHPACLCTDPTFSVKLQEKGWLCEDCKRCHTCHKIASDATGYLISCSGCEENYHPNCCGMENKVPEKNWTCSKCNEPPENEDKDAVEDEKDDALSEPGQILSAANSSEQKPPRGRTTKEDSNRNRKYSSSSSSSRSRSGSRLPKTSDSEGQKDPPMESEESEGMLSQSSFPKKLPCSDKLSKEKAKFFKMSFGDKGKSRSRLIEETAFPHISPKSSSSKDKLWSSKDKRQFMGANSDRKNKIRVTDGSKFIKVKKKKSRRQIVEISENSKNSKDIRNINIISEKKIASSSRKSGHASDLSSSSHNLCSNTSSSDESGAELSDLISSDSKIIKQEPSNREGAKSVESTNLLVKTGVLDSCEGHIEADSDSGGRTPQEEASSSSTNSGGAVLCTEDAKGLFDGLSHLYTPFQSRKRSTQDQPKLKGSKKYKNKNAISNKGCSRSLFSSDGVCSNPISGVVLGSVVGSSVAPDGGVCGSSGSTACGGSSPGHPSAPEANRLPLLATADATAGAVTTSAAVAAAAIGVVGGSSVGVLVSPEGAGGGRKKCCGPVHSSCCHTRGQGKPTTGPPHSSKHAAITASLMHVFTLPEAAAFMHLTLVLVQPNMLTK